NHLTSLALVPDRVLKSLGGCEDSHDLIILSVSVTHLSSHLDCEGISAVGSDDQKCGFDLGDYLIAQKMNEIWCLDYSFEYFGSVGDCELVSKKNLWEFVAEECGLDITHAASLKLIFVKYLIELDQWLSHWGFKDTKLEIGELDVSEKLDCIESALEFNEKLDFDMKAKMELSGIKTIDGKDAEFGGFDLNIDQSELIFGRINNADDKDEVFGGLDLNIAHSELGFADDKNEFFGGLDLNIAQTEFGFPRTNKVDEKDKVLSGLNEKKIDLSSENFVKTVDVKHNDDAITKLCPMDVLSSQSKNNTIILSKNVKTVGRPRKRKKEEPISSFKMLEWLANAARNPHDLTFGSIPRISKWKKYKGNEVWKQVLLVKETLFAKQNVDSGNKLDCSQKKKRHMMHPSMYEDDKIPIHLSSKRIRCSQRVSSVKSCSCPGCSSCSSSQNKRVKKTPQILETIQTQDDACEDLDTESEIDIVRAEWLFVKSESDPK
ncbi:AT-rich interactive domain-containing protein 2-like protein, partial [Tanacetum coccineum]